MSNKPTVVTAQALVEFHRNLLKELSGKYGGDFTINELRIMNQIIRCNLDGRTCHVTGLHKVTGIPIPTVSRTVAKLQQSRWLSERRDPEDGRKRVIFLGPRSLEETRDEIDEKIQWFDEYVNRGVAR
jgi:DNA-binding MarR family transcriptional regulator